MTSIFGKYGTVIQTDSSTHCSGSGTVACPQKEDWQSLTAMTTADGESIEWDDVDNEVIKDMEEHGICNSEQIFGEGYQYSGAVSSNYINYSTKEYIYRTAVWKANSLQDYTYTTTVWVMQ